MVQLPSVLLSASFILWVISIVTLILFFRKEGDNDHIDDDLGTVPLKDQAEHLLSTGREPTSTKKQELSKFGRIKWWSVLIFSIITTVLWWYAFIRIVSRPFASHEMLSPVTVMSIWGYFITLRSDMETQSYFRIRWIIFLLAILQFAAGGVALVLFYKSHGHAPQYTVAPSFDLSPFLGKCDVQALLFDPTNTTYLVSLGASPILLGYGLFLVALCILAYFRFRLRFILLAIESVYGILAMFSLISFAIVGQRETNPIAWDPGCGLVHVMLGSGRGYVDVKGPNALHTLETFLGIHW